MNLYQVDEMLSMRFLRTVKTVKKHKDEAVILNATIMRIRNLPNDDYENFLVKFGHKKSKGTDYLSQAGEDTDLNNIIRVKKRV